MKWFATQMRVSTCWRSRVLRLLASLLVAAVLSAQPTSELVVSVGHSGLPDHAAFAGKYLATASSSNVALIDLSTGLTTAHLRQVSLVESLDANSAGDLIAVGTCGHSIEFWDVKTRTSVRRLALKQECAEAVSFSPDGALLATGAYGCCSGGGLQIWDVRSGVLTRELGKPSGIRHVVFGGDGRRLVGVDDKGKAIVFEWPSGRVARTLEGLEGSGWSGSAAFASPDGNHFGWLGLHTLRVWNLNTGTEISLPEARDVTTAEFLNDGRLAYLHDDRLVTLTLPNGPTSEIPLLRPKTQSFGDVALVDSPSWLKVRRDGSMVAGTQHVDTLIWDVANARLRPVTSPALTDVSSLNWSRSGVIAWADYQSGIRAWKDTAGEPLDLGKDIASTTVAFDHQGQRLATSDSSSFKILELQRQRVVSSLEVPPATRTGIDFSPDGTRVAFASSEGLAIFDTRLHLQTRLEKLDKYTSAEYVAFSPDGQWLAAGLGGPQSSVKVWPVAGGNAVTLDTARVTYGPQPPSFSRDSRWLASFSKGEAVVLWSTESWQPERKWTLLGTGRALAFAPQGSRLAIAADGEAAIWDADSGARLATLRSPGSSQATQIAWSPDGNRVVSSADDGVLQLWNASSGQHLASLYALAGRQDWLLVASDGRIDGSAHALASLVAWRAGEQTSLNKTITDRRRVNGLWRLLQVAARVDSDRAAHAPVARMHSTSLRRFVEYRTRNSDRQPQPLTNGPILQ